MLDMQNSRNTDSRTNTSRKSARTITASAAAALALTTGMALPAHAADQATTTATPVISGSSAPDISGSSASDILGSSAPAADESDATATDQGTTTAADESNATAADESNATAADESGTTGETDARLEAAIEQAKAAGHISDDDWVADPSFEIARGGDDDVSAQVITIAGATGSSPQAVLLYAPGSGEYADTAEVPANVAGDGQWGDRVGNVKTMELTADKDIDVLWTTPDGQTASVIYRWVDGHFEIAAPDGTEES